MKIYSMTATFGKLSHQTLTLQPGLNIIEAPNEWGKSTWCAFLIAMLYGINTRTHTKNGTLAEKEHYQPWSGEPMSGSMELRWNGRDITIQRSNKGRGFLNDFKAFETQTGLPVTELTAENCGQQLLGAEQSVFTRAGFLRHTDLPVTADEKLRSRLNALVTTGDESGESEALAQKLKEIKNRCRFHRTGLLPQAEAQRAQLEQKLAERVSLEKRRETIMQQQQEWKDRQLALENHVAALHYEENKQYMQKAADARQALLQAQLRTQTLEKSGAGDVDAEQIQASLAQLRTLRDTRDALHRQARLLPSPPQMPQTAEPFRGVSPETAVEQAKTSARVYAEDRGKRYFGGIWLPLVLAAVGLALLLVEHFVAKIIAAFLVLAGILWVSSVLADKKRRERTMQALRSAYGTIPPEQWVAAAQQYAASSAAYAQAQAEYRQKAVALEQEIRQTDDRIARITANRPVSEYEAALLQRRDQHSALAEARRAELQAEALVRTLQTRVQPWKMPEVPDPLTCSMEQTQQFLRETALRQEQLAVQLGQCQGQLAALGESEELELQLQQINDRIDRLEQVYQAADYGLQMREKAAQELQRRFAPRIAKRARALLARLTDGRYEQLVLDQDLQISTAAQGEDTLRSGLWRSDGTVDQLYLALRLAVAEVLTPEAPLVLDDALVRFDEKRLASALEILREMAAQKQVILFTCQNRERTLQLHQEERI